MLTARRVANGLDKRLQNVRVCKQFASLLQAHGAFSISRFAPINCFEPYKRLLVFGTRPINTFLIITGEQMPLHEKTNSNQNRGNVNDDSDARDRARLIEVLAKLLTRSWLRTKNHVIETTTPSAKRQSSD
jgi:hypothetical protein